MAPPTHFSRVLSVPECSDAPNWSHLGIFSCHACDLWREKWSHKLSLTSASRLLLSERYQCSRRLSGQGLKINVVCGVSASQESTAAHPNVGVIDKVICCPTSANLPVTTAVKAMEGHVTHSRRFVTPAHPPPENVAVNTIDLNNTSGQLGHYTTQLSTGRSISKVSRPSLCLVTPQSTASQNVSENFQHSINAVSRKKDAISEEKQIAYEKSLANKVEQAKAIECHLMSCQCSANNEKMMQMSQLVCEQKQHMKVADEDVLELKEKIKANSICSGVLQEQE